MKFSLIKTRSIVILGYCLLVALAMIGIVTIYLEVIKSHKQGQDDSGLKKELINLSNTLTIMYQAEGTAGLLAYAENSERLKLEYDSLTNRVFEQIDSLRLASTDSIINQSIDSLSALLSKKRSYALEMFHLVMQIDKDVVTESTKRTIISGADSDKLKAILANVTQAKEDTVHVVAEKKGFFQRIRAVVKSNADTLTHISNSSVSETKELMVPILSDTIIDFIRKINTKAHNNNAKIFRQLVIRQQELYIIKELTGLQINRIVDTIKDHEYQASLHFLKEKNESLKRSSSMVAIIGLSALFVVIFFMSWTVQSLNKAQRLQKSIEEAKKHAEKLLTSREQLIYTITHDIKAPLNSINGFIDLMLNDSLTQKQQYYLDNMHSSSSHILDLVNNLLDFHSIEKEQPQLTIIPFLPNSLIHSIYESFLPLTQKKQLTFELRLTPQESQTFLSDPYYIRQIVNNLLSNAIKYTNEKGRILLNASMEEQNRWKISVQDNGPGIDIADQLKIFDEFVRLDKQKIKVEGTGLGLTISKELAVLLGGIIEVESEKGKGSIFTLTVPLTPAAEKIDSQTNSTSGGILFIDDDRAQLNLLSEWMKKEELPYTCCSSAHEALNLLTEKPMDIIFTDIHIPDMKGFELMKRIKELNIPQVAGIPIIAFSADRQKRETDLQNSGFTEFLLKPFTDVQLLDIIEKYTSFKRKTHETRRKNEGNGWQKVMDFSTNDPEASLKILDSFIEETKKDKEQLSIAFQMKDTEAIKHISHKMLTLIRMISANEIDSILTDFETGILSEEKKETLFRLLDETLKDAETTRSEARDTLIIHT